MGFKSIQQLGTAQQQGLREITSLPNGRASMEVDGNPTTLTLIESFLSSFRDI